VERVARLACPTAWVALEDVVSEAALDIEPEGMGGWDICEGLLGWRDGVGVACGVGDDLGGLASRDIVVGAECAVGIAAYDTPAGEAHYIGVEGAAGLDV